MYLLFDIGGTHMRVGVSRDGKTIDGVERGNTPATFDTGMKQLASMAQSVTSGEAVTSVFGGIAGLLAKDKKSIVTAPNIVDWEKKPLQETIEGVLGAPTRIENDAAVAGLGEAVQGAGQGYGIVAYVTVSTGVGGARIVSGKIDSRTYGFEPGQHVIEEGHTFEQLVSGGSLAKQHGKDPSLIEDEAVWKQVHQKLAIGLHNTMMFWSPEVIVLGGGLVESNRIDLFLLQQELVSLSHIFPELPVLKKAALGDMAGLIGALQLAI